MGTLRAVWLPRIEPGEMKRALEHKERRGNRRVQHLLKSSQWFRTTGQKSVTFIDNDPKRLLMLLLHVHVNATAIPLLDHPQKACSSQNNTGLR